MIRRYNSWRFRNVEIGDAFDRLALSRIGTIVLIQGRKLQVLAWLPRDHVACDCGQSVTGRIASVHLAQVRDLATGRIDLRSDAWLEGAVCIRTDEPNGRGLRRRAALRARQTALPDTGSVSRANEIGP